MESLLKDTHNKTQEPTTPPPKSEFSPLPEDTSNVHVVIPYQPSSLPDPVSFDEPKPVDKAVDRFFDRQILSGLEKIPATGSPGTLVVTGDAQPIFTGKLPSELFLAACEYGNLF
jgi:hypothetical protein